MPALLIPELMAALRQNKYPPALQAVKGSDSVFLALARTLAIPLVTLDREQLERAPADVEVFTSERALAEWGGR
ncbi:MAG: hypothetical protein ACM30E_01720 [Nitrososphaerales archaeon]